MPDVWAERVRRSEAISKLPAGAYIEILGEFFFKAFGWWSSEGRG